MFNLAEEKREYYGGLNRFHHSINDPLQRFRASFANILKTSETSEDSFAVLNELEQILLSDFLSEKEQIAFMVDKENEDLIAKSRKLNILVDGMIEKTFARLILEQKLDAAFTTSANPILQAYLQRFDSIAREEIKLASIQPTDHVLFIGGGGFPITSINYVRYAQCKVSCVERIADVKKTADSVIDTLNLSHKIHPILGEGQLVNCSSYDVIIVGVLARPKDQIIQNIISTAKPDVRIICRTTFGVRSALCPPLQKEEILSLKPLKSIIATGNQTLSSILFKK